MPPPISKMISRSEIPSDFDQAGVVDLPTIEKTLVPLLPFHGFSETFPCHGADHCAPH